MSVLDGLALIGVLLVALVLVREAARWDRLRRERKRHIVRYYWEREETFGTFVDTAVRYPRPDC